MHATGPAHTAADEPPVLVVEDIPEMRYLIADALIEAGFLVKAATTRAAALWLLDRCPTAAVLDMDSPMNGGHALALLLHEREGNVVPIVALASDDEAITCAHRDHASAVLPLPCDLEELVRMVEEITGQHH